MVSAAYAELIVVNTCTVTGEAEKKTRKAIHRALRANEHARVIVTGCAASVDPEGYSAMDERITVVDKSELLNAAGGDFASSVRVGSDFPARVGVKIQDGCDHACTFCIVHVARGKAWSRPSAEILAEVKALAASGVSEIVMTGIDLGSYLEAPDHDLCWLLRMLMEEVDDCRFRISSIEPISVNDELIALMAGSDGRICRHLHLPLQSGSSKVLAEMERPYDAAYFRSLVTKLRDAMPDISLTTDLMVAFPGETEEDFRESLEMARFSQFSKIHVFRYSKRAGTPAARRLDQVPAEVSERRAKELRELSLDLHRGFGESLVGRCELVAVESDGMGMSDSFYRVRLDKEYPSGSLVSLCLTSIDGSGIFNAC